MLISSGRNIICKRTLTSLLVEYKTMRSAIILNPVGVKIVWRYLRIAVRKIHGINNWKKFLRWFFSYSCGTENKVKILIGQLTASQQFTKRVETFCIRRITKLVLVEQDRLFQFFSFCQKINIETVHSNVYEKCLLSLFKLLETKN